MTLRELLEKATPRPWVVGYSEDLSHWPVFRLRDMVNPTSPQEEIADAELIQHAVNKLEGLLEAMRQISTVITDGSKAQLKNQVSFAKGTALEAIREAEEVTQ